jgi:hypothetical protein
MTVDGLERFPSARDIEKVARNPECRTLRTALAANVDPRKLAVRLGLPEEKQSPLAIARGQRVEREILGNDAARLVERFVEDGKIRPRPLVKDLGRRAQNRAGMLKVAEETERSVRDLLEDRPAPDLLLHPVLTVRLGADIQVIEPDALVRYRDRPMYEPVELKSYPYRQGRTDPDDLRQARRQGAVYVYALRALVTRLGGDADLVPSRVTLVFTRPDSMYPSPIYEELVEGENRDVANALLALARLAAWRAGRAVLIAQALHVEPDPDAAILARSGWPAKIGCGPSPTAGGATIPAWRSPRTRGTGTTRPSASSFDSWAAWARTSTSASRRSGRRRCGCRPGPRSASSTTWPTAGLPAMSESRCWSATCGSSPTATTTPGSRCCSPATEVLGIHFATGQSAAEDAHLGAMLAWIEPPHGVSAWLASREAEELPAGVLTDVERVDAVLEGRLTELARLRREKRLVQLQHPSRLGLELGVRGPLPALGPLQGEPILVKDLSEGAPWRSAGGCVCGASSDGAWRSTTGCGALPATVGRWRPRPRSARARAP